MQRGKVGEKRYKFAKPSSIKTYLNKLMPLNI